MFDVKIKTEPTTWPVTLDEVKAHLHITDTDNDTQLTALFKQVTKEVEGYCGISLGTQTRIWTFDFCAGEERTIPYGPVASITSVNKKTAVSTYDTLTADDDYEIDGEQIKSINVFGGGRCKVEYVAGTAACPEDLKLGILNEIANRYENRGDESKDLFSKEALGLIIRHKDFNWE